MNNTTRTQKLLLAVATLAAAGAVAFVAATPSSLTDFEHLRRLHTEERAPALVADTAERLTRFNESVLGEDSPVAMTVLNIEDTVIGAAYALSDGDDATVQVATR